MTTMTDIKSDKNVYLSQFEHFERTYAQASPALRRLRKAAIARFAQLGFPDSRNEDWKFTSTAKLAEVPFRARPSGSLSAAQVQGFLKGAGEAYQLVFVDGEFNGELSVLADDKAGFVLTALSEALGSHAVLVETNLGRLANYQEQPFTALNTAFVTEGAFLQVPDNKVIDRPIYLHYITTAGEPAVTQPRSLLLMGVNSQVTVIETWLGLGEQKYWTNAVTEARIAAGARLDHYRVQQEGSQALHVSNLSFALGRSSWFSSHTVSLGGALVRNESHALLDAEGGECTLNGLYLGRGTQHIDNHTVIDHAQPHCASHELYKGILDGNAKGVFNGKIFVRQDAQKTDAKQTNQTLLLSDDATINTKPQLEIFADDVKCTHGATVGNLNEDSLFYLRSRGLGLDEARSLLTFAFANDIVRRIQVESLRKQLEDLLLSAQHLPGQEAV
jgi:Fe-S cluster assembly protein SufD